MSTSSDPARGRDLGSIARLGAAVAVFVSGMVHLQLYFDGYRDFPDANLGRSFVANGVVSVVVAAALVVRRELLVRLAAAALLGATLVAFALSRTGSGVFGFTEQGLSPSPQATLALTAEIVGVLLLAATMIPRVGSGRALPLPAAAATVVVAVVVAVAGAALWAQEDVPETTAAASSTPTSAPGATTAPTGSTSATARGATTTEAPGAPTLPAPTASSAPAPAAPSASNVVTIVDFTFEAAQLEVPVGTTVEWVNEDSFAHSVVAVDGSFRSEDLDTGDRFSFTFTAAGEFTYICGIHPSMQGTIVVTG